MLEKYEWKFSLDQYLSPVFTSDLSNCENNLSPCFQPPWLLEHVLIVHHLGFYNILVVHPFANF
jgi:hypothetical protein